MSIDARELRIGNWVETYTVMVSGAWYDKEGKQHGQDVVTEPTIRKKQIDIEDLKIIASSPLATYRPIPLTPEILEKCGFEDISDRKGNKDELGNEITVDWIRFALNITYTEEGAYKCDMELEFEENDIWYVDYHSVRIKYLHQLQNLYFALTGEELKIDL